MSSEVERQITNIQISIDRFTNKTLRGWFFNEQKDLFEIV